MYMRIPGITTHGWYLTINGTGGSHCKFEPNIIFFLIGRKLFWKIEGKKVSCNSSNKWKLSFYEKKNIFHPLYTVCARSPTPNPTRTLFWPSTRSHKHLAWFGFALRRSGKISFKCLRISVTVTTVRQRHETEGMTNLTWIPFISSHFQMTSYKTAQ